MVRICLFKGESQYDVTRIFIDQLSVAFRGSGHDVHVVDLLQPDWTEALNKVIAQPVAMFFAFNAVGIDVQAGEVSLYERMGALFVASLMDHPVHHLARLEVKTANSLVACVDRTHVAFVHDHFQGTKSAAFLPHAGIEGEGALPSIDERDRGIIFSGSYNDPDKIAREWKRLPESVRRLFHDIADHLLAHETCPLADGVRHVLAASGLHPSDALYATLMAKAPPIDGYVRASWRRRVLDTLVDSGLVLDVFGDNWKRWSKAAAPNVRVHPAVGYLELLQQMRRARIVLNVLPAFPAGSHDRVFCAMLNGAVCVSDTNTYLSEEFCDGQDGLFFSARELPEVPERVRALLASPTQLEAMAASGRAKCLERHQWSHRATTILSWLETWMVLHASKRA